jgi:hypothetical protein
MNPPEGAPAPVSAAHRVLPFFLLVIIALVIVLAALFIAGGDTCGVSCSYIPSAVATCTGENISITYQGGGQYPSSVVNISAYDTDPATSRVMGGTEGVLPVGSQLVLEGPFFSPAHIVAVAQFQDGAKMVTTDTSLRCGSGPARTRTPDTTPQAG